MRILLDGGFALRSRHDLLSIIRSSPHGLQIVFGLLCTAQGCPIAVEVFEGSTGSQTRTCSIGTNYKINNNLPSISLWNFGLKTCLYQPRQPAIFARVWGLMLSSPATAHELAATLRGLRAG